MATYQRYFTSCRAACGNTEKQVSKAAQKALSAAKNGENRTVVYKLRNSVKILYNFAVKLPRRRKLLCSRKHFQPVFAWVLGGL